MRMRINITRGDKRMSGDLLVLIVEVNAASFDAQELQQVNHRYHVMCDNNSQFKNT